MATDTERSSIYDTDLSFQLFCLYKIPRQTGYENSMGVAGRLAA